jgi:Family of unknown function (DUF6173)
LGCKRSQVQILSSRLKNKGFFFKNGLFSGQTSTPQIFGDFRGFLTADTTSGVLWCTEEAARMIRGIQEIPRVTPKFPDLPIPNLRNPLVENAEANYASEFYNRIVKLINDFDASLDNEHEVGIRLVNFGQTVVFHLEDIGFWNPSLIFFIGKTEDDEPVQLIQHVSQISILLRKLQRKDASKPKHKIGFHAPEQAAESNGPSAAIGP